MFVTHIFGLCNHRPGLFFRPWIGLREKLLMNPPRLPGKIHGFLLISLKEIHWWNIMPQRTPLFLPEMDDGWPLWMKWGGKSPSQINKVGAYSVVTQWEPRRWGKHVGKCLDLGIFLGVLLGIGFLGQGLGWMIRWCQKNVDGFFFRREIVWFLEWAWFFDSKK